jgi:hypothetical protein
MKKLLAYCVVSHERPDYLEVHLSTLKLLRDYSDQISFFIFDNSLGRNACLIKHLSRKFGIKLLSRPGCTQADNYSSIKLIPPHHYIILAHDDDCLFVNDPCLFLNTLHASLSNPCLSCLNTIWVNDGLMQVHNPKICVTSPFANSLYPWSLPAFPAWIYPFTTVVTDLICNTLQCMPAGKYSDIILVSRILDLFSTDQTPFISPVSGLSYIYRVHESQDSNSIDFPQYINMLHLLRYFSYAPPGTYIPYVFKTLLRFIGSHMRAYWL